MEPQLAQQIASQIASQITAVTGQPFVIESQQAVGGGCISQAMKVADSQRSFFVKVNQVNQLAMFEAERDGLQAMYDTGTIRVPQPLCCGVAVGSAYIVMEWLELSGSGGSGSGGSSSGGSGVSSGSAWKQMGEQLAAMHQVTSANKFEGKGFGWYRDNTIGATPQQNGWKDNWVEFWRDRRIGLQFELAYDRGGSFPRRDELMSSIPRLLAGHNPEPVLLHGDLWSGNAAISAAGEPVILDPATYYGDAETDLAMTELFGRFPAEFYQAYNRAKPIAPGYEQRKVLYNLYHILNHFNLFGGSYRSQANRMIDQILA